MKRHITCHKVVDYFRELLYSPKYLESCKQNKNDFTRNRKMPFPELILFMLNLVRTSSQIALNRFFKDIKGSEVHMSQQSFSEARQKLKWEGCRLLLDKFVGWYYDLVPDFKRWRGYRVLAVDGSKQQLPSDPKLRILYGTAGRGDTAVTGQCSTLYDVLNDIIIDARLEPISTDERSLALQHIEHLRNLSSYKRELVIFDRGYASFDLIKAFSQEKYPITFLFRLRSKFNVEIDKLPIGDHTFTLTNTEDSFELRVVKFELNSGEIETLLTNLWDEDLTLEDFKELYFQRWTTEVKYGELKHKLEIENFSGRTQRAILQDFYITAFLSNMVSIFIQEAQEDVDIERQDKDNKYKYNINVNDAVGNFKDRFIIALLEDSNRKRTNQTTQLIELLKRSVVPERPDRSIPRNPNPRKANFYHNRKSNC